MLTITLCPTKPPQIALEFTGAGVDLAPISQSAEATAVLVYLLGKPNEACSIATMARELFKSENVSPVSRGLKVVRQAFGAGETEREQLWTTSLLVGDTPLLTLEKPNRFEVRLTLSEQVTVKTVDPAAFARLLPQRPQRSTVPSLSPGPIVGLTAFWEERPTEYAALVAALKVGNAALTQAVALRGMGGIGKTQLAVKYALDHAALYPGGVWWLRAESKDRLIESLVALAYTYIPEQAVRDNPELTAQRLCAYLPSRGACLCILDNADTPGEIASWIAMLSQAGKVLLTTRATSLPQGLQAVPVSRLNDEQGVALLLRRSASHSASLASPISTSVTQPPVMAPHISVFAPQPPVMTPQPPVMGESLVGVPTHKSDPPITGGQGAAKKGQGAGIIGQGADAIGQGEPDADALALVQRLGGLPLAIDQAGAFLAETGRSVAWYLERYEQAGKELRARRKSSADEVTPDEEYSEHVCVAKTFDVTLEHLQDKHPATVELLYTMAFLAADDIPETIFTGGAEHLTPLLAEVAQDEFAFLDVVQAARNLSLIEPSTEAGLLSIHRVVQDVLKDKLSDDNKKLYVTAAMHAVNAITPNTLKTEWWVPTKLHSQNEVVIAEAMAQNIDTNNFSCLLNEEAIRLQFMAQYQKAELLYRRLLYIAKTNFGASHQDTGICLNNLALLLKTTGRYNEAEPLLRRALEIAETNLGISHQDTGIRLNNLAELLKTTGRYDEAEPLYRRALEIAETNLGENHPDTGIYLNNLAELLRTTGHYDEAEPLYRKALEITKTNLGENHPDTGIQLNNLALLLKTTGRYDKAEQLYRRALKIDEAALGTNHPDMGIDYNNLASLLRTTGRYDEAEPLYRRALEIAETNLGENHSTTGTRLNNLAGLLETTGRYGEAEPLYRRAVVVFVNSLTLVHPSTQGVANNWLMCLQEMQEKGLLTYSPEEIQEVEAVRALISAAPEARYSQSS